MRLSTILRASARRWYLAVPGLLLAVALAAGAFLYVPRDYTSSGIAVFVQPRSPVESVNLRNPLLAAHGALNTETMSVAQALSSPDLPPQLGLVKGRDSYTVKNTGSSSLDIGTDHPFLYISTQSTDPARAVALVSLVMDQARQLLAKDQATQRVNPRNRINLNTVVDATTPKPVLIKPAAIAGTVGALTILAVLTATCAWDARATARQRRRAARRLAPFPPPPPAAPSPEPSERPVDVTNNSAH